MREQKSKEQKSKEQKPRERKPPLRKCAGCQQMLDKRTLIRVTRSSDGKISIDPTGKAQGRGAYVCKNVECLEKAVKSKGLERSFKCSIPRDVYETLKEKLQEVCP